MGTLRLVSTLMMNVCKAMFHGIYLNSYHSLIYFNNKCFIIKCVIYNLTYETYYEGE